jgi:hypothetical protein
MGATLSTNGARPQALAPTPALEAAAGPEIVPVPGPGPGPGPAPAPLPAPVPAQATRTRSRGSAGIASEGGVSSGRVAKRARYIGVAGRFARPADTPRRPTRVLYQDESGGVNADAADEDAGGVTDANVVADAKGAANGNEIGVRGRGTVWEERRGAVAAVAAERGGRRARTAVELELEEELASAQALAQHYRLQAEALALQLATGRCGMCGQVG